MRRPIPPLPSDALTLVQVGGRDGLPQPWEWVDSLNAIRFADVAEPADWPGVKTVIRTLADGPGEATLHLTREPGATSTLAPNESFLGSLETGGAFDTVRTTVHETTTLDESLAALGVDHVDALDLDTPGREHAILEGAHRTLTGRLFAVEVDVALNPLYEKQPLAGEIDALLRRFGYELFQLIPRRVRRPSGLDLLVLGMGQPVSAEALYLKRPDVAVASFEALADNERERAVGRAVSVCLLYGFGDYALDLVDSTPLGVPAARRLRRTILRYDAHIDRSVPPRFLREEHGRVLQPVETWLGELRPALAPGRTFVSLELAQARRLFRVAGRADTEIGDQLREALEIGLQRLKDERAEQRTS